MCVMCVGATTNGSRIDASKRDNSLGEHLLTRNYKILL